MKHRNNSTLGAGLGWKGVGYSAAMLVVLASCAVPVTPQKPGERAQTAYEDLQAAFAGQDIPVKSVTLSEALQRAIRYNLEGRVKLMEEAVAQQVTDNTAYDFLPKLTAQAGYAARSNPVATVSKDLKTGEIGTSPSTSEDTIVGTSSLNASWNILDFGVSYLAAKQQGNRLLIATEQKRKALHNLVQQTRAAYWRAVSAERLSGELDKTSERIKKALASAKRIEQERLEPPVQALEYQRTLLDILRQMQQLQRDIVSAKADLARLMNIPPGAKWSLEVPDDTRILTPDLPTAIKPLETMALQQRPELWVEDYQARISADETRKTLLRMLPGLEFSSGLDASSNTYLLHKTWAEAGVKLTWNLINLVSGPKSVDLAEMREKLDRQKRLALSVAILAQVHVAYRRAILAMGEYENAAELYFIDNKLLEQAKSGKEAATSGELDLIRRDANRVFSQAKRDVAYAELENAISSLRLSVGVDVPEDLLSNNDFSGKAADTALNAWPAETKPQPLRALAAPTGPARDVSRPAWTIDSSPPLTPAPPLPPAPSFVPSTQIDVQKTKEIPTDVDSGQPALKMKENGFEMEAFSISDMKPVLQSGGSYIAQAGAYSSIQMAKSSWQEMIRDRPEFKAMPTMIEAHQKLKRGKLFRLFVKGRPDQLANLCHQLGRDLDFCKSTIRKVAANAP
ncbi:Outer membrane efflux protein (modular protein) [Rhodospirillaceae bacterium LM-1]|nr:Outer membrane efflux protein (modular protein) [Rhodospirillaceae bacterium LM-1]